MDEDYDDNFEQGTFWELAAFADVRNLTDNFKNEEDLVHYIRTTLGYECKMGKTGKFGVDVLDKAPGSEYRFKRGVRTSDAQIEQTNHIDADAARVEFLENTGTDTVDADDVPQKKPRLGLSQPYGGSANEMSLVSTRAPSSARGTSNTQQRFPHRRGVLLAGPSWVIVHHSRLPQFTALTGTLQ